MAKCKHCGEEFAPKSCLHKYCSERCRRTAHYARNKDKFRQACRQYYHSHRKETHERNKAYYWTHRDEIRKQFKEYYHANREREIQRSMAWARANPDKVRKTKARSKRKYHAARRHNPQYRIDIAMAGAIYKALKSRKNGRKWESLVGYTTEELMAHLENQFQDWMTWENYGEWEIDHITPKSWFTYEDADDPQFKECWALDNLQPLRAKDNRVKWNKYRGNPGQQTTLKTKENETKA